MGRRLRFIPEGGALVEITTRTVGARYLLKPSEELNESIVGVIARAQQAYAVPVHALVFMSNHYHMLVSVQDACQMARFMNYVNGKLAKEAGRFNDWEEKFWSRRYQGIVVSDEELTGKVSAHDVIDPDTGEVILECNDDVTMEKVEALRECGILEFEERPHSAPRGALRRCRCPFGG